MAEELQILYEFFKEGDATEEELEQQYQNTLLHIENLEFKKICLMKVTASSAVLQITARRRRNRKLRLGFHV